MKKKLKADYTLEQFQDAVESVKNKRMTCTMAAHYFDIPYSTLYATVRSYGFDSNCKFFLINFLLYYIKGFFLLGYLRHGVHIDTT